MTSARSQSLGRLLVLYDCWKMCVMMGAICSAVSLMTLAGSSSGPVALFCLRFFNYLIIPFVPISRGGMLEYNEECPSLVLSSNIFIFLIETSCLDLCLTVLMGGARASVCGRSGRFCQVCAFFLGNPSVVQTWAGTDRVDVSVQLLVSFIIVLRYKCRP